MTKQGRTIQQQAEASGIKLHSDCAVCGRVQWGRWVYLGLGEWRHEECHAGSSNWKESQLSKSEKERSKLYPFFD